MWAELTPGAVDVWQIDLEADENDPPVVSPEENARAERFRQPDDGRRSRRARSALRRLLAGYVGADPRALVLETARHGKPYLADPPSDVRFNVSHAGPIALVAFARGAEVGVDVELRERRVDAVTVARHTFGESCARRLAGLPPGRRHEAFLHAWVRHEATVKCLGSGLGSPPSEAADVWVTGLDVAPDMVAAVAARPGPCSIRLRVLPAAGA